jgi:hypothetical protein
VQLNDGVTPEVQADVHVKELDSASSGTPSTQQPSAPINLPPIPDTSRTPRP